MNIMSGVRVAGFFLVAGSLTLGGCGYKNQPVPPDSVVPVAVNDLRYAIDESGLTLNWTFPTKNVAGNDLTDVQSFELYRAVVPMEDYCGSCPIPFGEPIAIDGGLTSDSEKGTRQATYKSALLRSGHKYFFKVRSRISWWADSADSNIVSFVWHVPAKAPAELMVDAQDSLISLSWMPVTTMVDGKDLGDIDIRYQILRSENGKDFSPVGELVAENSFKDTRVMNGKSYSYKVQSFMLIDEENVEGGVSDAVTGSPVDMTPPVVVAGVTAIASDDDIKVIWNPSSDEDVAAYRIYRRLADQNKPEMIGEVKAIYTIFVDDNVPAGQRAYYSVTAVDNSSKANESILSREATVRD